MNPPERAICGATPAATVLSDLCYERLICELGRGVNMRAHMSGLIDRATCCGAQHCCHAWTSLHATQSAMGLAASQLYL